MQTSRYFFALWPTPVVAGQLQQLQRQLPAGKCLHPADLHLTLAFLGGLCQSQEAQLVGVLHDIPAFAVDVILDRVDSFRRIALTWAGSTRVPDGLNAMQACLAVMLSRQGLWHDDQHGFRPHITLARKLVVPGRCLGSPVVWHADRLVLARSGSLQAHRRYTIVAERHLRAGTV